MDRANLRELHYITPIANVPSILQHGLLSHQRSTRVGHTSVAMPQVQARRAGRTLPSGRPLHAYANLYLTARNPMLYKLRWKRDAICVLSVGADVLDLPASS